MFSILSLSAVPAFAAENNGNINIKGNNDKIQIKKNTEINNYNITLDNIGGHWAEKRNKKSLNDHI
jgi:hypothetical protein